MLKKRIIPVQLMLDGNLVKTVNFDGYRHVGDVVMSSKVYNSQDADEMVFLNINRSERSIEPLIKIITQLTEVCFMPLALGGGIHSLDDAKSLIRLGADKVVINSICYHTPQLITEIADLFGSQAVIVSMDVRKNIETNQYELFSDCGRVLEQVSLEEHIKTVVKAGAGELFVNSIDRDGTMSGYDIELIQLVTRLSTIPVIACGGSGTLAHLQEAFTQTEVSALGCGSVFNFGDNNPLRAKAFLKNYNIPLKKI